VPGNAGVVAILTTRQPKGAGEIVKEKPPQAIRKINPHFRFGPRMGPFFPSGQASQTAIAGSEAASEFAAFCTEKRICRKTSAAKPKTR
jgi:hypothetical protein